MIVLLQYYIAATCSGCALVPATIFYFRYAAKETAAAEAEAKKAE
jgi:hypothetical protein